jgi:FkbM family methyltransferase
MSKINNYLQTLKNKGFIPNKILDIGANVGEFSELCKNVWKDSILYMVEANKNCEIYLKNTGNLYFIEVLSDVDDKEVDFFLTKENDICTGNSLYLEKTKHYSIENLIIEKRITKTVDSLFKLDEFDLIKLDTQGSELDILKGSKNILEKAKYVIIETSLKEYNEGAPLEDEIIKNMKENNFLNYEVIENHVWPLEDGIFKKGEIFQRDLIFYKK